MTAEFVSILLDLVFQTLSIYDDHGSRKAVDEVIIKALTKDLFMKSFAATLVQAMERHSKFQSLTGGYRLLKWSCILLMHSQFATLSKNGLSRVAQAQALVLHMVMQGPFGVRRACRKTCFHLFTKVLCSFSFDDFLQLLSGLRSLFYLFSLICPTSFSDFCYILVFQSIQLLI